MCTCLPLDGQTVPWNTRSIITQHGTQNIQAHMVIMMNKTHFWNKQGKIFAISHWGKITKWHTGTLYQRTIFHFLFSIHTDTCKVVMRKFGYGKPISSTRPNTNNRGLRIVCSAIFFFSRIYPDRIVLNKNKCELISICLVPFRVR